MKIERENEFINQNRDKLTKYAENLEIIAKDIDSTEFNDSYESLTEINPKIIEFWDVISTGALYYKVMGVEWYNMANWESILDVFEKEIKEIIGYFRDTYPIYFETIKF